MAPPKTALLPLLVGLAGLAATLQGCDAPDPKKVQREAQHARQEAEEDFGRYRREAEARWDEVEHSEEAKRLKGQASSALRDLANATKRGAKDAGDLANATKRGVKRAEDKALQEVRAAVRGLCATCLAAARTSPLGHDVYEVPPRCLLAMAVGAGAVAAGPALGLAALGFAAEGVEAESLAALWHSALGDVEAGSLFARLQSLGAKGLSTATRFRVTGAVATGSACFCGVLNSLCHHCIVGGGANSSSLRVGDRSQARGTVIYM